MSINIKSVWEELKQRAEACRECEFCNTRAKVVFGEGPIDSKVVIVGEAPGKQENLQGRPFIGPAGDLLTKILQNGGGIKRDTVYIKKTRQSIAAKANKYIEMHQIFGSAVVIVTTKDNCYYGQYPYTKLTENYRRNNTAKRQLEGMARHKIISHVTPKLFIEATKRTKAK